MSKRIIINRQPPKAQDPKPQDPTQYLVDPVSCVSSKVKPFN